MSVDSVKNETPKAPLLPEVADGTISVEDLKSIQDGVDDVLTGNTEVQLDLDKFIKQANRAIAENNDENRFDATEPKEEAPDDTQPEERPLSNIKDFPDETLIGIYDSNDGDDDLWEAARKELKERGIIEK